MGTRQLTTFDIPYITDTSPLSDQLWICARRQSDRYQDDTALVGFDVRAGKVAARIECGVPHPTNRHCLAMGGATISQRRSSPPDRPSPAWLAARPASVCSPPSSKRSRTAG